MFLKSVAPFEVSFFHFLKKKKKKGRKVRMSGVSPVV